jgi:signal peptidase II
MRLQTRLWAVAAIVGATLGLDRLTKNLAIDRLADKPVHEYLGGVVRLLYEENPGAMLGLGSGLHEMTRFWVFTVLVGIVLIVMVFALLIRRNVTPCEVTSFSLIVGGGAGNVIDRLMYDGIVVDFVNIGIGSLRTGVFNVADTAVMAGVALYLICQVRLEVKSRRERAGVRPPSSQSAE